MNLRALAKNASIAFLAQGVAMGVSVITTLLVPKVLGVEQYGYWQLFIFYSSYVGFCHLGLNDGVYLVNGGLTRDKVDRRSISSQLLVETVWQIALSVTLLIALWTSDLGPERSFVLSCTAMYMVVKNAASYLGYMFQAMNETVLYSGSCILERLSFLVPMAALLVLRVDSFAPYVTAYLVAGVMQLAFCLWFARDILAAGLNSPRVAIQESCVSVKIGIRLMLANIASQLILGVARFVIDLAWGIETFGQLSLSLSMVNFFLAFVTQASMVLFPALRQSSDREQIKFYCAARDGMATLFPAVYLLYWPIRWIIGLWLPQYADSLAFFVYLLPICVFDSKMNVSCTTLFKVRREEATLFSVNVTTMILSGLGTLLGAYVFESVYAVIAAVTIAIVGRSAASEIILTRRLCAPIGSRIVVGELAVTVVFVVASSLLPVTEAIITFTLAYAAYLAANHEVVRNLALQVIAAPGLKKRS